MLQHNMAPLQCIYQGLVVFPVESSDCVRFDNLPEELIDRTIGFLQPDYRTVTVGCLHPLLALSMASRKLHRITEPHLYNTVPLTANSSQSTAVIHVQRSATHLQSYRFAVPTSKGANLVAFLRTISARIDLRRHVKHIRLFRCDWGSHDRALFGYYGYKDDHGAKFSRPDLETAIRNGKAMLARTFHRCSSNTRTLSRADDQASALLSATLLLLPELKKLDAGSNKTDTRFDILLFHGPAQSIQTATHTMFANLQELRLNWARKSLATLWPIFSLRQLRKLSIVDGILGRATEEQSASWLVSGLSQVGEIHLHMTIIACLPIDVLNPLYLMSLVSVELHSLEVYLSALRSRSVNHMAYLSMAFAERLGNIQHLTIVDSYPQVTLYDKHVPLHQGSYYASLVGASKLRTLHVNLIDMVRAFPESRIPSDVKGLYKLPVITPMGNIYPYVDLTLPKSLVTLIVWAGGYYYDFYVIMHSLIGFMDNTHNTLPELQNIQIVWHQRELCLEMLSKVSAMAELKGIKMYHAHCSMIKGSACRTCAFLTRREDLWVRWSR